MHRWEPKNQDQVVVVVVASMVIPVATGTGMLRIALRDTGIITRDMGIMPQDMEIMPRAMGIGMDQATILVILHMIITPIKREMRIIEGEYQTSILILATITGLSIRYKISLNMYLRHKLDFFFFI